VLPASNPTVTKKMTKAKPIHSESSLLKLMETAGKELDDEELRQAIKECGLGTPATRAAVIETLFTREYITRDKKKIVPTEKGLQVYGW
jgi:DNA topoisomerase-3